MENRLIELETRLAFLDDALQSLNTVVVRQQLEIVALTHEVAGFKVQLQALAPALVASRMEETPPPHY